MATEAITLGPSVFTLKEETPHAFVRAVAAERYAALGHDPALIEHPRQPGTFWERIGWAAQRAVRFADKAGRANQPNTHNWSGIAPLRVAAGLRQVDVALRCGVSTSSVARWESGDFLVPTDKLATLAAVLGVPVGEVERRLGRGGSGARA